VSPPDQFSLSPDTRLRGWLDQTRERVLQRLIGLLITAVAVQILVNGLKGCFPILA